jgi:hypothetical protein
MDVVRAIGKVPTLPGDRPVDEVKIEELKIREPGTGAG